MYQWCRVISRFSFFVHFPCRVVTHNSLFEDVNRKALQFSWLPANDTLPDMKLDPVSQLLKEASIQLCVLVYKCNVFENLEADFANEAVRIFNRYLIDNEKSITTLIDRESGWHYVWFCAFFN